MSIFPKLYRQQISLADGSVARSGMRVQLSPEGSKALESILDAVIFLVKVDGQITVKTKKGGYEEYHADFLESV